MFELLFRLQLPYSQTLADGDGAAYLLFNRGQQVGGGGISHVVVVGSSFTTQHLPFLHRALPWSRHSPCTQEHKTHSYYHLYAVALIHYYYLALQIQSNITQCPTNYLDIIKPIMFPFSKP